MISVIIPAYNEERRIGACLESLTRQATAREFEVIVVDNASTDKTAEKALAFRGKLNLTVASEPQKGRGAARKTGFSLAKGDLLLSLDADSVAPAEWIERYAALFRDRPGWCAATGPGVIRDCSPAKNAVLTALYLPMLRVIKLTLGATLNGANFAVRAERYRQSGGFDPKHDALEDFDLARKLSKLGTVAIVDNPAVISGRRFQRGVLRGAGEYLRTFWELVVLRKERVRLRELP